MRKNKGRCNVLKFDVYPRPDRPTPFERVLANKPLGTVAAVDLESARSHAQQYFPGNHHVVLHRV